MTLLLLPNLLGEFPHHEPFLPGSVDKAAAGIDGLIAESDRAARRFLSRFETKEEPRRMPVALYNEHTPDDEIDFILEPMKKGEEWGLISDGGLPCIADPGSKLVARARKLGIGVKAFIGPSSITLALMLSGLPGQRFAFNGYLPKKREERAKKIEELEAASQKEGMTQIFIEAPYRNKHALETLLETLSDQTQLSVGWDLTLPSQGILTENVAVWKKSPLPNLDKKCAIFLFRKF